jgi:hypothetical protein
MLKMLPIMHAATNDACLTHNAMSVTNLPPSHSLLPAAVTLPITSQTSQTASYLYFFMFVSRLALDAPGHVSQASLSFKISTPCCSGALSLFFNQPH